MIEEKSETKIDAKTTAIVKESNAGLFVTYRVSPTDYNESQRIATIVHQESHLKAPTVTGQGMPLHSLQFLSRE